MASELNPNMRGERQRHGLRATGDPAATSTNRPGWGAAGKSVEHASSGEAEAVESATIECASTVIGPKTSGAAMKMSKKIFVQTQTILT